MKNGVSTEMPLWTNFGISKFGSYFSFMFARAYSHLFRRLPLLSTRGIASVAEPTLFEKIASQQIPSDLLFQDDVVLMALYYEV